MPKLRSWAQKKKVNNKLRGKPREGSLSFIEPILMGISDGTKAGFDNE